MTPERSPLGSVGQVREELRRLGYLDSGLDRFVLTGAASASPWRASWRAAVRVGLVGGLLFGAALTLTSAQLDRRLLAEPQDLALLGVYLTVALGLAVGAGALIGSLAAAAYGRRVGRPPAPGLSRNIGLALAVAGLAYFALWWRSHGAGASAGAAAMTLLVGLGLSLALGRFGWLAAVAVLAAGGVSDRLPEASLSRRRTLPLVAGIAVLLSGGVAAAAYFGAGERPAPDFAVVPTGLRVRVLGIDGLDAGMAEQMAAAGAMPRLAALLREGAHGRLRAEPEQVPAIVWTTIATGRGPEAHGIQSAGPRRLPGMLTPVPLGDQHRLGRALGRMFDLLRLTRTQPATAVLRSAKTFWNVASEKGLRIGVVNWWATWPADSVNGYVVSDRAFFRLEKGGPPDREVFPVSAWPDLAGLADASTPDRGQALDRFALRAARALRESGRAPRSQGDRDQGGTPGFTPGGPIDLEAVYLPGLDIVTMQQLGEAGGVDLATLDARLTRVREHYRFVDGVIGEVADEFARGDDRDVLVLVGDPGRLARRNAGTAQGLLVLYGGPVRAGDLGTVSERDVAPTVLHLAGLPVSRELAGRALDGALEARFRADHPLRWVAAYGRRTGARNAESAFDRAMLEELRSLGYVQ